MEPKSFQIKTPVFEGPLDVLLDLIEKRKLLINDVSLAKVADDYIAYVNTLQKFPISEIAQFILIASTLVLIKSKSLLPELDLSKEEEASIEDLELRLKLRKRMKELEPAVRTLFGQNPLFAPEPRPVIVVFSPHSKITVANLYASVKRVLENLPKKELLPKALVQKIISLEEMTENLTKRIANSLRLSFKEFSKMGKANKVEVIVGFLAMLELVKQGIMRVTQERHFDDILMETEKVNTPRYGN